MLFQLSGPSSVEPIGLVSQWEDEEDAEDNDWDEELDDDWDEDLEDEDEDLDGEDEDEDGWGESTEESVDPDEVHRSADW